MSETSAAPVVSENCPKCGGPGKTLTKPHGSSNRRGRTRICVTCARVFGIVWISYTTGGQQFDWNLPNGEAETGPRA